MKNRAKCKLCKSVLESFHRYDYVVCKCGEISISGGFDVLECSAKDFVNFLRVDDEGNEIIVTVKGAEQKEQAKENEAPKPSKKEKLEMLSNMVTSLENLPQVALNTPITHFDLYSHMLLVLSILQEE